MDAGRYAALSHRFFRMPREHQFPFELRHLVYFHEVARTLHFNRAARALAVSQPSLSRQIHDLEDALGVRLLDRNTRSVELTPEGRLLKQKCHQLFPLMHEAIAEINELSKLRACNLRIMFTPLAMANVLLSILTQFAHLNSDVQLDLSEAGTEAQIHDILHGRVDFGFCHLEAPPGAMSVQELCVDPLGIVLRRDHYLASQQAVSPAELRNIPFIMFPERENPLLYKRFLGLLRNSGFEPQVKQHQAARINRLALAAAGVGVTYASACEIPFLPGETIFLPLKGKPFEIRTVAIWSPTLASPLANAFAKLVSSAGLARRPACPVT
jgi:DNA-binding transcriptional LysR family regulator